MYRKPPCSIALPAVSLPSRAAPPLGTLPSGMAALTSLTWLSVAGNGALSGYLPSAWAALGSLLWLDVRSVCR